MTDENLKQIIGANLASQRRRLGLTQAGLAEKLNYSDKAVSKWERGESVPDVLTLMQLGELFGVGIQELVTDPNQLPEDPGAWEKAFTQVSEKALGRKANKNVILALASTLVWFIALLAFVVFSSIPVLEDYSWLFFLYAIPVNAIVALSLRSAWHDFRWNQALISAIVWGSLICIYGTIFVIWDFRFWKVFLLGLPGQLAIFLWFRLFRPEKEKADG